MITSPPEPPLLSQPPLPPRPGPPAARRPRRRALLPRLLGLLLVAPLLAGGGLLLAVHLELSHPIPHPEPLTFSLPAGTSFRAAAQRLAAAGLIRRPLAFELYARLQGSTGRIKWGVYRFEGTLSPRQVLERITGGVAGGDVAVTLPEGLNRWEVAARLERAGVCPAGRFLAVLAEAQEGELFPETYRFFPDTPPERVIDTLQRLFTATWGELKAAHPQGLAEAQRLGLSERQLVVLASLVEKETRVAEERPRVARVLLNRLARGMKLQSDPSCVYGRETHALVPTPALCHDPQNRYSTYVISSLPPGPIANPGRASLAAVLAPDPRPEAAALLYFVARRDGTGRHDFSSTDEEHERKVQRYLRGKTRGGRR
ncbi:MAG: endolytic transglycosylase MltG [Deltaproteobacteria bacterium]|nr:endolytic transglycosylase MltG [Deltaproteobacteria bacterium]